MLREQKLILERWHRYFHKLLNSEIENIDPTAVVHVPEILVEGSPAGGPTPAEPRQASGMYANREAMGPDEIPANC